MSDEAESIDAERAPRSPSLDVVLVVILAFCAFVVGMTVLG